MEVKLTIFDKEVKDNLLNNEEKEILKSFSKEVVFYEKLKEAGDK